MTLPKPGGHRGSRAIRLAELADFDGGLNLDDDAYKLAGNETPDCLNVDFHARGGVEVRGGFTHQIDVPG